VARHANFAHARVTLHALPRYPTRRAAPNRGPLVVFWWQMRACLLAARPTLAAAHLLPLARAC